MKYSTFSTLLLLSAAAFSVPALSEVYFSEDFSSDDWEKRWEVSGHRKDYGKLAVETGKYFKNSVTARGLKTTEDARFYAISAPFDKDFDNKDKDMIVQLSVKHEQNIDCGGGYFKILPPGADAKDFHGESKYNIMFGPDICGGTSKIHAILNHNDENHLIKKSTFAQRDQLSHMYTFILKSDKTYVILVDGKEEASGNIVDDWDLLPPKKIKDPEAKKPEDWVDEAKIPDPEDVKPEDWDNTPKEIPDPEAAKPEDWDDDMDGDWEPPMIANPEYKGEWKPKMIDNPEYKGEWVHPEIDNPDYKEDDSIGHYISGRIGLDIWQVKSGTIFDDILITDDAKVAEEAREEFKNKMLEEKERKQEIDDEEKKRLDEMREKEKKEKESEEQETVEMEEGAKEKPEEATHDEL